MSNETVDLAAGCEQQVYHIGVLETLVKDQCEDVYCCVPRGPRPAPGEGAWVMERHPLIKAIDRYRQPTHGASPMSQPSGKPSEAATAAAEKLWYSIARIEVGSPIRPSREIARLLDAFATQAVADAKARIAELEADYAELKATCGRTKDHEQLMAKLESLGASLVADAVRAERERCARIVEQSAYSRGDLIAALIRGVADEPPQPSVIRARGDAPPATGGEQ